MFHHYCFVQEINTIKDHKPLVIIFQMDLAILSETKEDPVEKHQHNVCIIYKPGPNLHIGDWLL